MNILNHLPCLAALHVTLSVGNFNKKIMPAIVVMQPLFSVDLT